MHASTLPAATPRRSPLLAFAAVSLALHGALLLGWRPVPTPALAGGDTPSIAVVLQRPAAPPAPSAAARPTPPRPHRQAQTPATPPALPQTEPANSTAPSIATAAETTAAPAPAATGSDARQERLLGRIRGELLRYFRYPPLALRNGWQGTVLLGFRVNGQGDIEAIHVAHSSGYSALDDAAIGALRKVGRLTLDTEPTTQSFDLQLPVIYRLEES